MLDQKLLFVYLIIVFPIQVPKFTYCSYIWKQQHFYTPYLWWLYISFLGKYKEKIKLNKCKQ